MIDPRAVRPSYVILLPKSCGNPTDKYVVVHVNEYVAVSHNEKSAYTFSSEHDDYDSASVERDQLNSQGESWNSPATASTETTEPTPPATAPGEPQEATPVLHLSTATSTQSPTASTA